MRTIKGIESAKSEESLDISRKECYDEWMGVLDGVWEEIFVKSERRLRKGTLVPVLEGKRAERVEDGELAADLNERYVVHTAVESQQLSPASTS